MHELDALRRPGGARRVDQRQQVLGPDRAPGALDVEARVGALDVAPRQRALAALALEHHDVLELGQLREVLLLDDRDLRARVLHDVGDLLGRRGQVDRERHRAEAHHREVGEVELGAVGEHQRDGVAALDAERGETSGERVDALAQLAPGERDLVVLGADRHAVREVLGGDAEGLGDRSAPAARGGRPERQWWPCRPTLPDLEALAGQSADVVREPDQGEHDHEREAHEARPLHDAERDRAARAPSRPAPRRCGRRRAAGTGTG